MGHYRRSARRARIQKDRRNLGTLYRPWARARSLAPVARRIESALTTPHARVAVNPTGVGNECGVTYTLTARPGLPAMGSAVLTVESVAACVASLSRVVDGLRERAGRTN